ncbi:MAG: acyl carrier protein [Azoarcus sp.]|jgi:acyl carrier protein|nr:acyl carrier protein [Azoarcus sp.]
MTDRELYEGVCECIRQTLKKELPEIRESDRFIADLEGDSLDFLDLIFRLEERFSVRVNPRELERRTQEALGDIPMIVDERYTEAAIVELRKALPEVPEDELFPGMSINKFPGTLRVKTFMNLVGHMLESQKTI